MKRISNLCLPAMMTLGLALGACSGSQQDEEALAAEGDAQQEATEQEVVEEEATAETDEMEGLEEIMNDTVEETEVVDTAPPAAPNSAPPDWRT